MDLVTSQTTTARVRPYAEIPRAPRLPVIGSLHQVVRRRPEFFERAQAQCGALFVLDLGVDELVVVGDALLAEEVLHRRVEHFDKGGNMWDLVRERIGQGLTFSEGELWRRQRRLLSHEFRRSRVQAFRAVIAETVDEHLGQLDQLGQLGSGEAIDLSQWSERLLASMTARVLLGGELDLDTFERLRAAFSTLLGSFMLGAVTGALPRWVPVPGAGRLESATRTIHEIILAMIAERRRTGATGQDLLSTLVRATEADGPMSDQQLLDEIIVLYVAGYETTASALAWTTKTLADQPELVAELQGQLDASEDPTALPLLDATFREGLRMYAPAPFLPRRAARDEVLGGYAIPAGRQLLVMPWLIHHNPRYWLSPARFDPRRHLGEQDRPRLAWMPFGAGRRVCIGMGLGMLEGTLALAGLLRRFTPRPAGRPSQPMFAGTLGSADGVWVRLERRACS